MSSQPLTVTINRRAGRPTQDDARRKSEAALDVATEFFVERGFNGTTMEAVALAADIGKQALYLRYPDKESLFTAVIDRLKDDEDFALPSLEDGLAAAEGLRLRLRLILADCAKPKSMTVCKLVMREGHRFPDLPPLLSQATLRRFIEPLASYLEHLRRQGEIRAPDPVGVAAMCLDLIFAEITRAMFRDARLPPDAIDQAADRIGDLVFAGIA